ncbi:hypothetical protein ACFQAS_01870 [Halopenitus salinus]|uniref:Uncharacterized protein n=1 Tax=Halopenitus salinus TaxID=1198295 RepID=A0ABD5URH9_9EURY
MNRSRFVRLAVLAFGLLLLSFVSRGLARLVAGYETAILVSVPSLVLGGILAVYLTLRGLLDVSGLVRIGE